MAYLGVSGGAGMSCFMDEFLLFKNDVSPIFFFLETETETEELFAGRNVFKNGVVCIACIFSIFSIYDDDGVVLPASHYLFIFGDSGKILRKQNAWCFLTRTSTILHKISSG